MLIWFTHLPHRHTGIPVKYLFLHTAVYTNVLQTQTHIQSRVPLFPGHCSSISVHGRLCVCRVCFSLVRSCLLLPFYYLFILDFACCHITLRGSMLLLRCTLCTITLTLQVLLSICGPWWYMFPRIMALRCVWLPCVVVPPAQLLRSKLAYASVYKPRSLGGRLLVAHSERSQCSIRWVAGEDNSALECGCCSYFAGWGGR